MYKIGDYFIGIGKKIGVTLDPLLTDISAYFKLDESTGAVIDSVNANNGTNVGATPNVTGKINTAYSFDGVNDYINIDDVLPVVTSDTAGTWSAWVKPTDATPVSNERIISFGDTDGNETLLLQMSTSGELRAFSIIAGLQQWSIITDSAVFSDATWGHIAVTHNGTVPVLYYDGTAVAQTLTTPVDATIWFSQLTNLDNGRLGDLNYNSSGESTFFDGEIDEVDIHSRALSVAEITEIYNSGDGKQHPF